MYQIYLTENVINNKYYVGIHKGDVYSDYYYGSGVALKNSIKKYGRNSFKVSIISIFKNKELASFLEKIIIGEDAVKDPQCYNLIGGGFYPNYKRMSESSINKMLKNRTYYKGKKAPFFGKTHSHEIKNKLRKINLGRSHTHESKQKISESGIKCPVLQFSKEGLFIKEFESVVQAANSLGKHTCNIYRCCNGKRLTAYDYKWRYKDDL